ncbi:polyhydroxyalkanoate synthase [Sphaerotilus hippei]|uniref:Polyhydroxyalkanoate synthase n=1 Tax=Sphaerotilus hippei TaxID=744406 RepID=A0A318H649_9BURK|nr:alpha/beta fold hydrolase [Sphaerotilus hippei]PXW96990.1 polyhydroxyalkanoate synthase [Sphaerotilus hippei]
MFHHAMQYQHPHSARPAIPPEARARDGAAAARAFDQALLAGIARLSSGLSPVSLGLAMQDWAQHLMFQPAQALRLAAQAQAGAMDWFGASLDGLGTDDGHAPATGAPSAAPAAPAADPRFAAPAWQQWPWPGVVQAYLQAGRWWQDATRIDGMTPHHSEMVRVFAQQWLDMLSPSNLPINPEVTSTTVQQLGANLMAGARNALDDWREDHGLAALQPQDHAWQPGTDVAITPGTVVMRNRLAELIQYQPRTAEVHAEPILLVPSWIMKYYILDLSPHNSLVRWLVEQGHTVFILSWHNPTEADAGTALNDYLQLGVFDALKTIARLIPGRPVHAGGYCLGGTLLSMAAAALARAQRVRDADRLAPLASVSLLAAETDFSEPGEMGVLIDEAQVRMIEALMAQRGFLTGRQMAGSFQFLHSRELFWSTRMREYLLGERVQPNDLMAWNADVTRMPARMHSEYLRQCYLANALAEGRYEVEDQPVSLSDMRWPMFCVGTEKDHVSPWKSVYKIHRLTETALTFVLTSGGHNAGIVSEPGHPGRHYRLLTTGADAPWVAAERWVQDAPLTAGSWWEAWHAWLLQQGSGVRVEAASRQPGEGLGAAPGAYVHERHFD